MIDEPKWLERADVIQLHEEQISLYGGLSGVLNDGAIASTLARPKNLSAYGRPDLFDLAASYAFGFARNHCFVDGNKRIAFMSAAFFILDNGYLMRSNVEKDAEIMEKVAAGEIGETALADWFRQRSIFLDV